jgi:hypothetical protein
MSTVSNGSRREHDHFLLSRASNEHERHDFILTNFDSCLAVGTIVYRTMIREYHERYVSSSKRGKGKIVLAIVKGVTSVGGRFLRVKRGGIWAEVSGQNARESTRNALRQPW